MYLYHMTSCDAQVYVHDDKLTVGQLMVELIECGHLSSLQCPAHLFCSLQLGR